MYVRRSERHRISVGASRYPAHYVDGGITIQRFLREGLIQRIIITRVPVLIGDGLPLFGPLERDIILKHVRTQPSNNGLVQSEYEVTQGAQSS